jgi:putative peptidoglycan lipid II flippase
MVGFLVAFRVVAGPNPGLELTGLEQVLLGLGGTLGVVAFVAAPTIALARTGFRLRPKLSRRNERLKSMLALSGWAGLQQAFTALLLAAAIIVGGGVEGGVVAYQAGWVFFLAPYGIIAQPIHTTILPELVGEVERGDMAAFTSSVRWALDSMTMLLVPLTALALALAVPAMRVLAFGAASSRTGVSLLAAALGSLVLGLLPYGAFFLLARAWYVLGDSRRPAIAGGVAAVIGAGLMALAGALTDHAATVFALGAAHTVSFVIASGMLVVALRSRVGHWILPPVLPRVLAICVPVAVGVWLVERAWAPTGRWSSALALVVLAPLAAAVHFGIVRLSGTAVTPRVPIAGELA